MSDLSVCERIKVILADMTGTDAEEIQDEDAIIDDLGLASIEIYDLLVELEVEFSIKIPERVLKRVSTVEDMADVISELI